MVDTLGMAIDGKVEKKLNVAHNNVVWIMVRYQLLQHRRTSEGKIMMQINKRVLMLSLVILHHGHPVFHSTGA